MGLSEVPGASVFVLDLGGEVRGKPAPLEVPQPLSLVPTYSEQRDNQFSWLHLNTVHWLWSSLHINHS